MRIDPIVRASQHELRIQFKYFAPIKGLTMLRRAVENPHIPRTTY